jgi:hypothetical protein
MSGRIVPSFEFPTTPSEQPKQPRRRFSPQLIETTTRSRRSGDAVPTGASRIDINNIKNLKVPIPELTFGIEPGMLPIGMK